MANLAWLDHLLAQPPRTLSELEDTVGPLDLDFAGSDGFGIVMRPSHDQPGRGQLHAGIHSMTAEFHVDLHHEDPHRPRDMRVRSLALWLDLAAGEVRTRFDSYQTVVYEGRVRFERPEWFYLEEGARTWLAWYDERPEWALPRTAPSDREDFLATLVDRLACESSEAPIVSALATLAGDASAEVRASQRGIAIYFKPPIALALVVGALRWDAAVAYSSDVHMTTWKVAPRTGEPQLGRWTVAPLLERWPRGAGDAKLAELGRRGPSPLYDLAGCETRVYGIEIRPAD